MCLLMLLFMFVSRAGRRGGGAPREPRFARLALRPLSLFVELICVFMMVFMFVSGKESLASLASLASLGARCH